jgi:hypothetical protein
MKKLILFFTFILSFYSSNILAQPSFDNLTQADVDGLSKEFSANFAHRPISPASPLGDIFGFEVGIVAGVTDAPKVEEISKREAPNEDPLGSLAHAGFLASVSVPFGITPELILFPERELGDVTFSHYSLGVKWTFSKFLPIPFVDLAARIHTAKTEVSFSDSVDGVNTTVNLENTTTGIQVLASANFLVLEPFAGIGYITRDTELGATGTAQIFDSTFSLSQTANVDGSSSQFLAGVQVNLFIMKIAAQYENVFGTSVTSAKLTFGF